MARKYINLFDENGNPVKVSLGADAENVDIEPINGLEAENVQDAIEELAGQQTTIEMDDVPTANSQKAVKSGGVAAALSQKQNKLTGANAGSGINISEQGVISATAGGGSVNLRGTIEQLSVTWQGGYIIANGTAELSDQSSWKVTDLFTVTNKAGKYLFIPGYFDKKFANTNDDWYMYSKFNSNSTLEKVQQFNMWGRSYLIIPITSDSESYRISMKKAYTNFGAVYLVDRDWLISAGYADEWTGKTWLMYGDSYVQGQDVPGPTWHQLFALWHNTTYINKGIKAIGLMLSASTNVGGSLLTRLLADNVFYVNGTLRDLDVIGICCGRNDYTKGVPIGNIDDMITGFVNVTDPVNTSMTLNNYTCARNDGAGESTTPSFMAGLNYICKWMHDNYPSAKVFFVTPWWFLDDKETATEEPLAYVEAVKTIASRWGIPCFDAAYESGICPQTLTFRHMYFKEDADTSHLNLTGHRRMATGPVAGWLENLFRD